MFNEDFKTNDIWKHFEAVKQGRVYDLTYELFGMSATFRYPEALEELQPMLYPEDAGDVKKAKESSRKARKAAKKSGVSQKGEKKEAADGTADEPD